MTERGAGAPPEPGSPRRVRRPNDVARLGTAAAALGLLVLTSVRAPDVVGSIVGVVPTVDGDPIRAAFSVASAVASLALLGVLVTVAVDAARHRRTALLHGLAALGLGLVMGAAGKWLGDAVGGALAVVLTGSRDDAALVPVVASVAFLVGATCNDDGAGVSPPVWRSWAPSCARWLSAT